MSGHNLSTDSEFRYIVQWFNEWSELQRDDFLPILVEYLTKGSALVYMNGVVSGMAGTTCNDDKPMSLFQCRVKLFREWSAKWPEESKDKLKEKILELDETFGQKLIAEMEAEPKLVNGNGTVTPPTVDELEDDAPSSTIAAAAAAAPSTTAVVVAEAIVA